jgi:hypothetical protein
MFKFNLFLDGVDLTEYVTYPIVLTEKNLNESENTYEIQLKHTPFAEPIKPNRKAIIRIEEEGILKKELFLLTMTDSVQKLGRKELFDHNLIFIEFTHILEQTILPDMRISRIEDVFEPTLKDAAEKVLFVAGLDISLSSATAAILDAVLSPELVFTRQTVLEALRLIFMIARVIPYMNSFTELSHVSIEGNSISPEFLNKFGAFETAYDPETYKTLLQTNTENLLIEDQELRLIEPKNAYISPRSLDGFAISNDDAVLPTTKPINNFYELYLRSGVRFTIVLTNNQNVTIRRSFDELENDPAFGFTKFFTGLKDFVFEESVYQTLENTNEITYDNTKPPGERFTLGRGAALFYKQGERNINGLGNRAPSRFSLFPTKQAIQEIIAFYADDAFATGQGTYPNFPNLRVQPFLVEENIQALLFRLTSELLNETSTDPSLLTDNIIIRFIGPKLGPSGPKNFPEENTALLETTGKTKDLEFRIEYDPFVETNIRSYLPFKEINSHTEMQSGQYFNQQNNVVSIKALEELQQRVINRGRGQTEILTYLGRTFDELPDLGTKVNDFVLTAAEHTINRNNIISDYTFDEFFAKLNKFIGVLEQYRQFSIPNENLVKRQFDSEVFGKFTTEPKQSVSFINLNDYIGNDSIGAIQFDFGFTGAPNRRTLPATVTTFNNQVRVEIEAETNAKFGDKSSGVFVNGEFSDDVRRNSPVLYVDENGFIENVNVRLIKQYAANPTF